MDEVEAEESVKHVALVNPAQYKECIRYWIKEDENPAAFSAYMENALFVPEGLDVDAWLETVYPGKYTKKGSDSVFLWSHRIIEEPGSLEELLLEIQAHGTILVSDSMAAAVADLRTLGYGHWQESCKLQAFCNGLIVEFVSDWNVWKCTLDAKRAQRVIKTRAKHKDHPLKLRPQKLREGQVNQYGAYIKEFIWKKLDLDRIKASCFAGTFYTTFRSGSWQETIHSVDCMHRFCRHNKIDISKPVKMYFKHQSQSTHLVWDKKKHEHVRMPSDIDIIALVDQRIAKRKGDEAHKYEVKVLQEMRRNLQKGKKCRS